MYKTQWCLKTEILLTIDSWLSTVDWRYRKWWYLLWYLSGLLPHDLQSFSHWRVSDIISPSRYGNFVVFQTVTVQDLGIPIILIEEKQYKLTTTITLKNINPIHRKSFSNLHGIRDDLIAHIEKHTLLWGHPAKRCKATVFGQHPFVFVFSILLSFFSPNCANIVIIRLNVNITFTLWKKFFFMKLNLNFLLCKP